MYLHEANAMNYLKHPCSVLNPHVHKPCFIEELHIIMSSPSNFYNNFEIVCLRNKEKGVVLCLPTLRGHLD